MFLCPRCHCPAGYHGYSVANGIYSCHATADGRHPNDVDGVMHDDGMAATAARRSLGIASPKLCGWRGTEPEEQEPTPAFLDAERRAQEYVDRQNDTCP